MAGFHPHMPAARYSIVAKTLGASMWFWVMYKAKEEGPVVLVRYLSLLFLSCRTRSDVVQEFTGAMVGRGRNQEQDKYRTPVSTLNTVSIGSMDNKHQFTGVLLGFVVV
ncbi:hypothetical protein K457DRAFT_139788, partial [Linnemannia elongata AG-77]